MGRMNLTESFQLNDLSRDLHTSNDAYLSEHPFWKTVRKLSKESGNDHIKQLKLFLNDATPNTKPAFQEFLMKLKKYSDEFPKIINPMSNVLFRGRRMPLNEYKKYHPSISSLGTDRHYSFGYTYKSKKLVQSWTDDNGIANNFSDMGLDDRQTLRPL